MATEFMVEVSKEKRDAGWHLLELLDKAKISLSGLFWAQGGYDDLRLHLVSSRIGRGEAQEFWLEVLALMDSATEHQEELESLRYGKMVAVDPRRQIVEEIRSKYKSISRSDKHQLRHVFAWSGEAFVYFLK